jgi:outer membrane protein TolC
MSNIYTADQTLSAGRLLRRSLALTTLWGVLAALPVRALPVDGTDGATSVQAAVDALVADALDANLELDGAGATVTARLAALDQARARYLPALDFQARYTGADGGRTIEFPVGDLLNPVYATLNQLTNSTHFPAVANQSIDFQRRREQQTDVTVTQPLYDPRVAAARAAAQANLDAAAAGRSALAGRIERDMREAYYRWLAARAQLGILDATLELAAENLRVNDSLFKNGKVTRDLVYRAEADELEVRQSLLGAHNGEKLAQSYVNLLRNAPFERPLPAVVVDDADIARMRAALAATSPESAALGRLQDAAVQRRAEMHALDAVEAAAQAGERLARAAFRPQLGLAIDAGTQGATYGLSGEDRFIVASVVLRFGLFAGGADEAALAGARAVEHEARDNRGLQEQRIRLEVQQALQDLDVAQASLGTAGKRVDAAAAGFRIASRKRDLGQINQAEFIDARRVLTDAQLNLNLTRFAALSSLAELQYALGEKP